MGEAAGTEGALLELQSLSVRFRTAEGTQVAVKDLSLSLSSGETLGIVGESGSGKSVTALSIMNLIPSPPGEIFEGRVLFSGKDLLRLAPDEIRKIRGNEISMIFQEPMTSLNPIHSCGSQVMEPIVLHQGIKKDEAADMARELLRLVGIPNPERIFGEYPHQLSGGMRQRVMIAMALACRPKLLLADEPTTALDVTIQAQILELLKALREDIDSAIVLITHDLGVVAETCDRVIVMYAGRVVESSPIKELFRSPLHPYTEGLLDSIPEISGRRERLRAIEGVVPSPFETLPGCPFQPRCRYAEAACAAECPELVAAAGRSVRCWRPLAKVGWRPWPRMSSSASAISRFISGPAAAFPLERAACERSTASPSTSSAARPSASSASPAAGRAASAAPSSACTNRAGAGSASMARRSSAAGAASPSASGGGCS
jgi:oligopeptide/dipeptide ABC transporter ATP-binding protein